jgi:osmotically-inducible protein OsmY
MSRYKNRASLLCAFAVAALSVACSDDGVRQDADEAGEEAREAAREGTDAATDAARRAGDGVAGAVDSAGRTADAAMETVDVKAALVADSRIDASDINVDTNHQTRTVVLKGSVPTSEQKTLAGQVAAEQAVGYRVDNQLTVERS